jgi:hypothetical protein
MTTTPIFEIYKEKLIHAQGFRLNQKQELLIFNYDGSH